MTGLAPGRSGAPWSLRRRAIAICVLLGVVLAFLAAGATATAIANRGQLATLLDSVGPLRAAGNTLTTDLLNQETAVRGYVLNGEAVNLGPYYQGLRDARTQIERISTNPATTPEVRIRLETVTGLAYTWRTSFAEPAIDAMERGDRQRAKELLDDTARQQFEQVRSALDDLEAAILTVREQAEATVRDTSSTLLFVLIAVAVMMLGAGGGLLVALQRSVIGPVTHLAAQVRAVSRGNYRLQISAPGPPELQHLAQDVDTMRQRIAAELAEVRTAQRQIAAAHAALEQQAAELVRSNRDLEQFAYVASHDLQEPLRKVASFCQLLQRRYQHQLDERADQYLAFAVAGAQRMQRLINDLLAFSRIGRNTAGFAELDLESVAREAAEQAGGETAKVTWSGLPVVRGEETLLTTLLANLIGNAVKFARPGVTPVIHLSARRTGAFWEISCADNGIGIEPQYREKVFAIFQRLHPRDAYPGTGIGLAVAKKIVEYHGGEIWVDPDQAEGSTIRFTLPAAEPDAPLRKEALGDDDRRRHPAGAAG